MRGAMETANNIRPSFCVLSDAQKERIHSDSLEILSKVGVRIESKEARRIFAKTRRSDQI